ncbi:MAG TPA: cytochrome c biogenesis protein CcdA, partial [Myxococcota bacterium]|nr:cytochrome c biogenesis protein CcdA [Myxococcota bacterium]
MEFSFLGIFGAGLLTFLSPCVLPLIPVYLGILAGSAERGTEPRRARALL